MLLKGRYEILRDLSPTLRVALDRRSGCEVVVRVLRLQGQASWSRWERLEEEARLLSSVSLSCVPKLIDSFRLDEDSANPSMYLVQEFRAGSDLTTLPRLSEGDLRQLARELLEAVASLHRLSPPLLHGRLSPKRVVRCADGTLCLLGVGGASMPLDESYHDGFAAPERLFGEASTASDLYSVGAILYFLATQRDPATVPRVRGQAQPAWILETRLQKLITALLSLTPEERPTGQEALRLLSGELLVLQRQPSGLMVRPSPKLRMRMRAVSFSLAIGFSLWAGVPQLAILLAPACLVALYLGFRSTDMAEERKDSLPSS